MNEFESEYSPEELAAAEDAYWNELAAEAERYREAMEEWFHLEERAKWEAWLSEPQLMREWEREQE